jgi:hypothetical protein
MGVQCRCVKSGHLKLFKRRSGIEKEDASIVEEREATKTPAHAKSTSLTVSKMSETSQKVEMTITEVHDYSPTHSMQGATPYGSHMMMATSTDRPMICLHMEKTEKSPVEPNIPEGMREGMTMMKAMIPGMGPVQHVIAEAKIVLSPEEYDNIGRPRPHEKMVVIFEYMRPRLQ